MIDHKPKHNRIDPRTAAELYNKGLTDRKIAEVLGVSKNAVFEWRKRNDLPPNTDGADGAPRIKRTRQLTPLEQDAIAAREAGLTYGQYKARQWLAAQPRIGGRK